MGQVMATSQDFANYVCGPRLYNHYLRHLFLFMGPEWQRLMAGSTLNTIYMPVFKGLQILLPDVGEQKALAEALSDADALIESLEQLLAKKRQTRLGAMQELLTGKRRLPGFTAVWEECRVDAKGRVDCGKSLNVKGLGALRPYLRTKNVLDGYIALDDVLEMPMTDAEFEVFSLKIGDVLLNEGQTRELVGRCAMYRDEFGAPVAMQNQLLRFRPGASSSGEYAAHLFSHCQKTGIFGAIATQTTSVAHLGVSRLRSLKLPWPSQKAEQTAIADVLSDMDAELTALEAKLAKARQLKHGMMQELLTGRIRLVEPA